MSEPSRIKLSRRKLITTGLAAAAGALGLGAAARIAQSYGLIPPDHGGIYGLGETLTYASQRLLTRHSLAREFLRSQISKPPFPNEIPPLNDAYKRLQAGGFADWRFSVNGMVAQPASFSLEQLKSFPSQSQITMLQCEEGWSYIAEWIGVPLSRILESVGIHPQARYVVYTSIDPDWWESIDMADAMHPQTFLAYGMNGGELPATRLQEREICHSIDGDRQPEKIWQRSRLRVPRRRLRLVRWHLTGNLKIRARKLSAIDTLLHELNGCAR